MKHKDTLRLFAHHFACVALVALWIGCLPGFLLGQGLTGRLSGTVTDPAEGSCRGGRPGH